MFIYFFLLFFFLPVEISLFGVECWIDSDLRNMRNMYSYTSGTADRE